MTLSCRLSTIYIYVQILLVFNKDGCYVLLLFALFIRYGARACRRV